MGWWIECENNCVAEGAWANQIKDLLRLHRREDGRFVCQCGALGRINKEYKVKGKGEVDPWRPELIGAVQPDWTEDDPDGTYQPFLFVTREHESKEIGVWCRYYKRLQNGNLKFGDGPGGGPVFGIDDLLTMIRKLIKIGVLDEKSVAAALRD